MLIPTRTPVKHKPPKIAFLPAGDYTTASTRIRVFALQKALHQQGTHAVVGYAHDADVLVIQKRVDRAIIRQAEQFKRAGGFLIYDCDDLGRALYDWSPPSLVGEIIAAADVVTTNTHLFRQAIIETFKPKDVAIVPDIVDYFLSEPMRIEPVSTDQPLRVLWFGNVGNAHLVLRYVEAFRAISDCTLTFCTDASARREFPMGHQFSFVPWSLDSFPGTLRNSDITLLLHDGAPEDRAKSNNRMITSLAWGVPSIVSRTAEYEALANAINVPDVVLDGPASLAKAIEFLRPVDVRLCYVSKAQPIVWSNHSPIAVAQQLIALVSSRIQPAAVTPRAANLSALH